MILLALLALRHFTVKLAVVLLEVALVVLLGLQFLDLEAHLTTMININDRIEGNLSIISSLASSISFVRTTTTV